VERYKQLYILFIVYTLHGEPNIMSLHGPTAAFGGAENAGHEIDGPICKT